MASNAGFTHLAAAASAATSCRASTNATGASSGRNMADDDASLDELLGINDHHGAPLNMPTAVHTKLRPVKDICVATIQIEESLGITPPFQE
jgi:hypothetical protein